MTLDQRIAELTNLFTALQETSSRNEKISWIDSVKAKDPQLERDLTYALEILDGRHKLGFTFLLNDAKGVSADQQQSLEQFLQPLYSVADKSVDTIRTVCRSYGEYSQFVASLVNRLWRLGIGKSQLEKKNISPMLAKKFDPNKPAKYGATSYYITEKLDGNRCIAVYDDNKQAWQFFSRNGKPMKVDFCMKGFPTTQIYDGEVLSTTQYSDPSQASFNATSGLINSHRTDKDLVYVIFDIVDTQASYEARRAILDILQPTKNVEILPVLSVCYSWSELCTHARVFREKITARGGEGVMVNIGSAAYQQKRTDALLKYKESFSMDMRVTDVAAGTGKFEGLIGALLCEAKDGNKVYLCRVGSGLTEQLRMQWADRPEEIIGAIVEVEYFSLSQDETARGSNTYSLRFPRFKRVRYDKDDTSVY